MRLVALTLLSAIAGCAYPEFAFGTDGAADSRADDSAPADSFVDDSFVDDSALDGASPDAIFPTDDAAAGEVALPDTSAPVDSGPKLGCAALASMFCRDFDSAATPTTGWVDSYVRGGGALTLDGMVFRSPSRSLLSALPVSASSAEVAANVHASFTADAESRAMFLSFWLRFDVVPTAASGPMVVKLSRGGMGRGLAIYAGAGTLGVDAMGPTTTTNHRMTRAIAANTWMHIRLEGVLSPTTGSFKLYLDDKLEVSKTGLPTTSAAGNDVKVNVGLYHNEASPALRAYYDDVQFDWM